MLYVSTRDAGVRVTGTQAVVQGISREGGLFVPVACPRMPEGFAEALRPLSYAQRAARVLAPFLDECAPDALGALCEAAYTRFDDPAIAKTTHLSANTYLLELFHGPTLAFKDMALQLLPHLLATSARLTGEKRKILILVATSGDTGKAALEGFRDVPGVSVCVFFPHGGVSKAQWLQMVTQEGQNVRVAAVKGNFDDTQTGVKQIFTDPACNEALNQRGIVLSSANSINLGRLIPQIAYYYSAYADLRNRGALAAGEPMDVSVPTGNFGNILAAHYAREMGLPIGTLVCASNQNNVLTDFIRTGVYDRNRPFVLTTSPSMDILISSNLERLLYELVGRDDAKVRELMKSLQQTGRYNLPSDALAALQAGFFGGYADEPSVAHCIRDTFEQNGQLIDPHTAVALKVAQDYHRKTQSERPMLVVATASPYKFGRAVLSALTGTEAPADDFACCAQLAARSGQTVPGAITALPNKPVLHGDVIEKNEQWAFVRDGRG